MVATPNPHHTLVMKQADGKFGWACACGESDGGYRTRAAANGGGGGHKNKMQWAARKAAEK